MCIYTHTHIYIYIYRERERARGHPLVGRESVVRDEVAVEPDPHEGRRPRLQHLRHNAITSLARHSVTSLEQHSVTSRAPGHPSSHQG